jgi:hypothetical protein
MVFITVLESVYSAVRTDSLYKADLCFVFKRLSKVAMRLARMLISETRCPGHHNKAWWHIQLQAQYFYQSINQPSVLKLILYRFNFYIHLWRVRDVPENLLNGFVRHSVRLLYNLKDHKTDFF